MLSKEREAEIREELRLFDGDRLIEQELLTEIDRLRLENKMRSDQFRHNYSFIIHDNRELRKKLELAEKSLDQFRSKEELLVEIDRLRAKNALLEVRSDPVWEKKIWDESER